MVIVYRMRGLLGDATEPFITNFSDADHKESMDDAQLRMARLMGDCVRDFGTIISSLDTVELTGDGKKLLKELHRLLAYCVKVEKNRHLLIENKAVRRFLRVFEIVHRLGVRDADCDALALNYLELVRALLVDVLAKDEAEESAGGASFEQMSWLLELSVNGEAEGGLSGPLWESVTSLIPNLCVGNTESMDALVEIFRSCCDWEKIDTDRSFREVMTKKLDTLCVITASIYASAPGARLKNRLLKAGLIEGACHYLAANHPSLYNLSVEGPEWKQFLAKPSLKYVLRFMEGMAAHHKPSQIAIAEKSLPILHRLEQISSSEHIGTFAEDVIEALKESEEVAAQIERVRQETKAKKRQLAMAMRQKQLSKMGMAVGKKGVVKVTSRKVVNEPEVKTDSLESCCICREELGSSEKIMMVYAFASRQELKTTLNGRNFSFYSVSQLNFVHLDCHITAIRVAGSRDEWASAALHNANTKCNILVPVWSKNTKDAAMNHAVLRLISDLDAAVGFGALTLDTVTLDITELISRFVRFLSFSELSQGGGRESNLQYLCVLILLGLHVKANNPEMVMAPPQSLEHQMCACLVLESTAEWNEHRVSRIREIKNSLPRWETAKHTLMVWAVVNHFQNVILNTSGADRVSYIRENIARIIERCPAFVIEFDTALSQCGNFATFLSLNELQADFNGLDDMLD
ncbi:hypothetical protein AB6A40_000446 [Gnathostoma spinigerum]|uniref:E3 ubiquitin ligase UBR4 C-terminal domain-containing protein n=1 Tax=Gnathostoma spinigerum TaxID=75299 RepID=A0ABD6E472_9BILA